MLQTDCTNIAWINNKLRPFRNFATSNLKNKSELFTEFYFLLKSSFNLQSTYMYILESEQLGANYNISFKIAPSHDIEYKSNFAVQLEHDNFVLEAMKDLSSGECLWSFTNDSLKASFPDGTKPENLVATFFTDDEISRTIFVFYTLTTEDTYFFDKSLSPFILNVTDIASHLLQKNYYRNEIDKLLYNDHLTNTPNRTLFYHMLVEAMQIADYSGQKLAVLMFDISKMKHVNDSFGYYTGDQVIKEVGNRLKAVLGSENPLSRFSGVSFATFIRNLQDYETLARICNSVEDAMVEPILLNHFTFMSSVKIGISVFPRDGESVDEILKNAEAAMFEAKRDADKNYLLYSSSITEHSGKLLSLNSELLHAISNQEFELYYQGQLDLDKNLINNVEALIRWNHPLRGILPPFEFIPYAEANGLIIDIDKIVLRKALTQAKIWYDEGKEIVVGVNISADHFRDGMIVTTLTEMLDEIQVPPRLIEIEILESVLIENLAKTIKIIEQIKALGVIVSLDDFGSGYSSLEYITSLPIDILKIDRSFTMNLEENPRNKIIIRTIISLAKEMNFRIIAEGVEKQTHIDFLRELNCNYAQGYFINKPLPVKEIERLIRNQNSQNDAIVQ